MVTRVLIITDLGETLRILFPLLQAEDDFAISTAPDMESGFKKAQTEWPSLILLDLRQLAEIFKLCQAIRSDRGTEGIPIIIRAAAADTVDRIAGLEAGADDYIGRQFHPREIVLRIKAVLRRRAPNTCTEQLVRGPISVDPARCQVAIDNHQVHLTAVEFKLLRTLVQQPGQVQSRETLRGEALGNGELLESRTIDTHIRRLRRKLGAAAGLIETVRGSGYRLRPI